MRGENEKRIEEKEVEADEEQLSDSDEEARSNFIEYSVRKLQNTIPY